MDLELIFGNKNYSSWSLRPWLVLKHFQIPFAETLVPLYTGSYKEKLLSISGAGKVPMLRHGKLIVTESLAIMEYLAELFPEKGLWPTDQAKRATARSISNEMHAGFTKLRTHMPMNIRARFPGKGRTPEVDLEIARVDQIWSDCRAAQNGDGDFLFGKFSIADAMYAPVVMRFHTYGVSLSPASNAYAEAVRGLPAMQGWIQAAEVEPYVIESSEIYRK
jgi:glutathione S-transferase